MNETQRKELAALIDKYSSKEGTNETPVPGVFCYKATASDRLIPSVYDPSLCVIAQGHKHVLLNTEAYRYGPAEYLLVSVDLPMIGQVTEASVETPYLCLKINIDLLQLSELLMHLGNPEPTTTERGLFVGTLDEAASDSILQLARLMDTPADVPVLSPLRMREIYYRLLSSDHGDTIAQFALSGSTTQRISSAIQRIKSNLDQPIRVKELAEHAGMSVSSFHAHFKSVTALSPLQYQKQLRLMEARQLMLTDGLDAASTAYRVGYESPSQFSREYARLFGYPPRKDVRILRQQGLPAASETY